MISRNLETELMLRRYQELEQNGRVMQTEELDPEQRMPPRVPQLVLKSSLCPRKTDKAAVLANSREFSFKETGGTVFLEVSEDSENAGILGRKSGLLAQSGDNVDLLSLIGSQNSADLFDPSWQASDALFCGLPSVSHLSSQAAELSIYNEYAREAAEEQAGSKPTPAPREKRLEFLSENTELNVEELSRIEATTDTARSKSLDASINRKSTGLDDEIAETISRIRARMPNFLKSNKSGDQFKLELENEPEYLEIDVSMTEENGRESLYRSAVVQREIQLSRRIIQPISTKEQLEIQRFREANAGDSKQLILQPNSGISNMSGISNINTTNTTSNSVK